MNQVQPPVAVLRAFGFGVEARVSAVAGGLINHTFLVEVAGRQVALQRLHTIFAPEVNLDIEAITRHLAQRGMLTPRIVPTRDGALWTHDEEDGVWRALSWLPGRTLHRVELPPTARAAAQLVARFHGAVADLAHSFHFERPGAHDIAAHLARLQKALTEHPQHPNYTQVASLGEGILAQAAALEPLPSVPTRLIHGDLKISNILFDQDESAALALLDLDTMANLTIPIELGDALRSWCNPAGEDVGTASFRADIFEAAIGGYADAAGGLLTPEERGSLVLGAQTIALELAARFCADALNESYFGWNAEKFASRSEHNRIRAESQRSVASSVLQQRVELERVVRSSFSAR